MRAFYNMAAILMAGSVITGACSAGPIYRTSFDKDPLASGEWRQGGEPSEGASASYRSNEGTDSTGCIFLSSDTRGYLYISHLVEKLDPGKLYRMGAKLRTRGVQEGRGAILTVKTDDSQQIWNASEFVYGDTDWQEVYIDFVPSPSGTAEICCNLGNFGGTYNGGTALGEAWFDDICVDEVTDTQMYFRSGRHISLAIDRDKTCIPDTDVDKWLENLDRVYESYADLVGDCPYNGERITVLTTPGIEPGYWALAGNPILWNNHVGIEKLLKNTAENGDWNFGVLHEIGHTFSPGTVSGNGQWNWNDEIFANFRMSYALETCGGAVSQRNVLYLGREIIDYYKIFYDETIGSGIARNNGDALHYTFLRIKEKYGWDVYKKAFRSLYALTSEEMPGFGGNYEKFLFFLSHVSAAAGEDVTVTCYTPEELKLIEESLK
ncbi:MAG: M60 family metallopeptidase [Bacteroidales bacterium]|nr:M60 family metallopeptidase [Bacteroidales bacterium]